MRSGPPSYYPFPRIRSSEQAGGCLDHLTGRDAPEAPEIARRADALVARPARETLDFYGNGGRFRIPPRL